MFRFLVGLLVLSNAWYTLQIEMGISSEILPVQNVSEFARLNPEIKLIPLARSSNSKYSVDFYAGQRQPGDTLVAEDSDAMNFARPQSFALAIRYPAQGLGAVVTHVVIKIDKSNRYGDAYIVEGGIGQRTVTVLVEAVDTTYFNWHALFYGAY